MKILHTGDWHLNHPRVPNKDTIADIRKHLLPKFPEVDAVFITGDVFDGLVSFNSDEATDIVDLMVDIMLRCVETGVKVLRVLQGTFTHDRHQLKVWDALFAKLQVPLNYRSIVSLQVEYLEALGIHVLYLPDNLPYRDKQEVFQQVDDQLTAFGIRQVDYVVMHGEFDHTSYGQFLNDAYNANDFKTRCKGRILAGHVHTPQRHQQVIYSGSVNRLAHGEEEAKGFWIHDDKHSTFIQNPDATLFKTVDYTGVDDLYQVIERHQQILSEFPTDRQGFIRPIISDQYIKNAIRSHHREHYPHVKLTFKQAKSDSQDRPGLKIKSKKAEQLEVPSPKNIAAIVCGHLKTKNIELEHQEVEELIYGEDYG